ncbi:MlaD family protein [Paracoccus sp. (in: a-proteobacteria)]|uniref:MlaD family protein n=1 Tax=Paracoccus sp. TaxID=267 RepID=UPI003A8C70CD
METRANFILIGAFTIAGFVGLLGFLIWFAKIEMNRQFAYYDIYFPEVSGLGQSSDVAFAGLLVGRVLDMQLVGGSSGAVRVRIEVAEDTPVRVDSRASIEVQGVTGYSNVSISPGSAGSALLREVSADGVPVITANRSALQTLTDQGPEMISRLNTVAEQMTRLLGEENQTRVRNILDNVERSSANLDQALADVSSATSSISDAAANISSFGDKLDGIGKAAENTMGNLDAALARFGETADKADAALQSGTATLDEMRDYVSGDLRGLTRTLDETASGLRSDIAGLTRRAGTTMDGLDATLEIGSRTLSAAERTFEGADRMINTEVGPVATDLRATLARFNEAIGSVTEDIPEITARLRNAADSADSAFSSLEALLDSARAPVQAFTSEGLPQFSSLARDLRGLVQNVNRLVDALRRNPSQIITGPRTPEFRR